jgi:2,3-bisphosphoglycerate-independent phosphoglycerate mutase
MADHPIEELGRKTPLEFARTPFMDRMAGDGTLGLIYTIPDGLPPGSDVANLSVLGYDPKIYYTGRGPLEAASMGISLGSEDVAFRCNLVKLGVEPDPFMEDFTAGHISSEEAKEIIHDLDRTIGGDKFRFYPGVGYRHLMVWKGGSDTLATTPPHDITGKAIEAYLPKGEGAEFVVNLMKQSREILLEHRVNKDRMAKGKEPCNCIWLWGQGRAPRMDKLSDKYGLEGAVISAVDLLNGIGRLAGLEVIKVKGATGYTDTNYEGKALAALKALEKVDFMFVHVEAPDEMGHEGNLPGKIKAIEDFDEKVVGTVLEGIKKFSQYRVLVLSDHPTPTRVRTHVSDPSPFAVLSSMDGENLKKGKSFHEAAARETGISVLPGHLLMDAFIRDWRRFVEDKCC